MPETDLKPEERLHALLKHLAVLPLTRKPDSIPLSTPQIALLDWVARNPGIGVLEIAERLQVTPPTVSVAARRLVKAGWLEYQPDPHDRRAKNLFVTPKGEKIVAELLQHRSKMLQFFLSGLLPDEQKQLISLLERAIDQMEVKLKALDQNPAE